MSNSPLLPDAELARQCKLLARSVHVLWSLPDGLSVAYDLSAREGWQWYGDDVSPLVLLLPAVSVQGLRAGGRCVGLETGSLTGRDWSGVRWLLAHSSAGEIWVCVEL